MNTFEAEIFAIRFANFDFVFAYWSQNNEEIICFISIKESRYRIGMKESNKGEIDYIYPQHISDENSRREERRRSNKKNSFIFRSFLISYATRLYNYELLLWIPHETRLLLLLIFPHTRSIEIHVVTVLRWQHRDVSVTESSFINKQKKYLLHHQTEIIINERILFRFEWKYLKIENMSSRCLRVHHCRLKI